MTLEEIVRLGLENKATDIHLEPKLPITVRVHGGLKRLNVVPDSSTLRSFAETLLSDEEWSIFLERGSWDLARKIAGLHCRINILRTDRGVGFAIRLLASANNTLKSCNLHPQLADLLEKDSGLIIVTGPTGSGKSTTLAALLEEVNQRHAKHVITLECPIEYRVTPKRSIVRQREVGLHTPSFEQGLIDSLREDPDVLVVGEMREAESMRLTLNAAETGHLVLATMHSASAMDAVYRIMMSFPAERQASVLAQIADTLIAIVSQKISYRADAGRLVPCLEITNANHAIRHVIRKGEISKIPQVLQTGAAEGMWTFERYQAWLDARTDWARIELDPTPDSAEEEMIEEPAPIPVALKRPARPMTSPKPPASERVERVAEPLRREKEASAKPSRAGEGRIEIPEMDLDLDEIVKELTDPNER